MALNAVWYGWIRFTPAPDAELFWSSFRAFRIPLVTRGGTAAARGGRAVGSVTTTALILPRLCRSRLFWPDLNSSLPLRGPTAQMAHSCSEIGRSVQAFLFVILSWWVCSRNPCRSLQEHSFSLLNFSPSLTGCSLYLVTVKLCAVSKLHYYAFLLAI